VMSSRIGLTVGGTTCNSGSATKNNGVPHHITFTADRDGDGQWYCDGAADGTGSDISGAAAQSIGNAAHALYVAARSGPSNYLAADIDELALYDEKLTGATVLAHAQAGGFA
jgi:hypothetical protein